MGTMDDGELDFSNQEMFSSSTFGDLAGSCFLDDFVDTHACSHTHTCNPPGLDNSHTHTCVHVHTKLVAAPSDDKSPSDDNSESTGKKVKKQPLGNRQAVRKYREKKKARAASLEEEVIRLSTMNQQLTRRLQNQALLEAEIARLKFLLVDIRGRIEGEIGSFPYQKPAIKTAGNVYENLVTSNLTGTYVMNPCNVHCDDRLHCLQPGAEGKDGGGAIANVDDFSNCGYESIQCLGSLNSGFQELPGCGINNGAPTPTFSNRNKRKDFDCGSGAVI